MCKIRLVLFMVLVGIGLVWWGAWGGVQNSVAFKVKQTVPLQPTSVFTPPFRCCQPFQSSCFASLTRVDVPGLSLST